MYFQIKEIILWPRELVSAPRRVKLELGKVNIISGNSRTGKSAIIPIIDYCLGADKCSIPVKTIRDSCSWFGVLLDTESGEILFARREPGTQKATGDMFVLEGKYVEVPANISMKNCNLETAKKKLDELANLTNLDFDIDSSLNGFRGRPSFRDLMAFVFQPQNIVANADVLYYKADTYEHREKLKTIFPYVLGAITPKLLAKQHELSMLHREYRRKLKEYENLKSTSERWLAEIQSKISEAKEYGLLSQEVATNLSKSDSVTILKSITFASGRIAKTSENTISQALKELNSLRNEESVLSGNLLGLRKRMDGMNSLKDASAKYSGALTAQRDRLQISKWLNDNIDKDHKCPICNNSFSDTISNIEVFKNALENVSSDLNEFKVVPPAFDREFQRVKDEIRINSEKLNGVKTRIKNLEKFSMEAKEKNYQSAQVARFIGSLEESLKYFDSLGDDAELRKEIDELRSQIQELSKDISDSDIKNKIKNALNRIQSAAGELICKLDNERPNDSIEISIEDLSIKILGENRADYLWEIGSGSNWVSYHIALFMGYHKFFLELENSTIPSLLIFDQPSQVYFPRNARMSESQEENFRYNDDDFLAVQQAFSLITAVVNSLNQKLQVIILDHASDDIWGTLDVNALEWRKGEKLIPESWINNIGT